MDHPKSILRSAFSFLSGTSLSRLTGLFREMSLAFCFGASPTIAAFWVAYRFANLMRRLFGEGALLAGFSPHFEAIRGVSPPKAACFFRDLFYSLSILLIGVIGISEIGLFSWWKWGGGASDFNEILYLTMWILPGVLFICLYALFSALLQCEKKYFLPGAAPVLFNLVLIGTIWMVKDWPPFEAAATLSGAVVIAFLFQWIMVIPSSLPFLREHLSWTEWKRGELFSPELKKMLGAMMLTIIGVGAVQINSALDTIFARYASLSGPAYLSYAIRLYQLPLALFGIALSSALSPPLARAIQEGALERFRYLLHFSLSRIFSLMLPATIAILVLGGAAVNAIYGRGGFDLQATIETTMALWGYGIGLVPAVFVLLLAPAFYAQKDFRTPLIGSVLSVGFNTALNGILVFGLGWGATSIAVATSVAAFFNCAYLSHKLSQKIGPIFDRPALFSFAKTAFCSIVAGGITLGIGHSLLGDPTFSMLSGMPYFFFSRDTMDQLVQLVTLTGIFGVVLFSYAWMLKAEEILQILKPLGSGGDSYFGRE